MCEGTFTSKQNYIAPIISPIVISKSNDTRKEFNSQFSFIFQNYNCGGCISVLESLLLKCNLKNQEYHLFCLFCYPFVSFEFVPHPQYCFLFFLTMRCTRETNKLECVKKRVTCIISGQEAMLLTVTSPKDDQKNLWMK